MDFRKVELLYLIKEKTSFFLIKGFFLFFFSLIIYQYYVSLRGFDVGIRVLTLGALSTLYR